MQLNYYPWDVQTLSAWIETEKVKFKSFDAFAQALDVSPGKLWGWWGLHKLDISLEQIKAIARYRNWSLSRTVQWLGISEMHLKSLEDNNL